LGRSYGDGSSSGDPVADAGSLEGATDDGSDDRADSETRCFGFRSPVDRFSFELGSSAAGSRHTEA
jgi:hypothetical protein